MTRFIRNDSFEARQNFHSNNTHTYTPKNITYFEYTNKIHSHNQDTITSYNNLNRFKNKRYSSF